MRIGKRLESLLEAFTSEKNASDLHVATGKPPALRVQGKLIKLTDEKPLGEDEVYEMIADLFRLSFSDEKKATERFEVWKGGGVIKEDKYDDVSSTEVDMAIKILDTSYRARVNVFMTMNKPGFILRKIPSEIPKLENLGFYEEHAERIRKEATRKEGLILVTGQTGSGKSTTLAAIIDYVNENFDRHVVTIEDPVEFVHKDKNSIITHREVGKDTESFYSGLKSALRQDPDIILVGEIRDDKTAMAALQASQTGHIVFATLHTNSAPETVTRFLDMFPPEKASSVKTSLAASLRMIISQKLAPSVAGTRILIYEIMTMNDAVYNTIVKSNDFMKLRDIMNAGRNEGDMIPLENCIEARLKEKDPARKLSPKTAMEYANSKGAMEIALKNMGYGGITEKRKEINEFLGG